MDAIKEWLKNKHKDYDTGVKLYADSPVVKNRILVKLQRGNNPRNKSVLIRELRLLSKARKPTPLSVPEKIIKKTQAPVSQPTKPEPQQELERKESARKSADKYFQKITYGALPPELKLRFREAKDIFYNMCDLKVAWNDLPDEAEDKALELQLQIETLDIQRETIWKELEHWQKFKTMLPTKADEDYSELTPQKLFLKKANLASSISKITKRIEGWEKAAEKESNKDKRLKIHQQINRSKKKLHQHEINLRKIEELL